MCIRLFALFAFLIGAAFVNSASAVKPPPHQQGVEGKVVALKGNFMPGPGAKGGKREPLSVPVHIFRGTVEVDRQAGSQEPRPLPQHQIRRERRVPPRPPGGRIHHRGRNQRQALPEHHGNGPQDQQGRLAPRQGRRGQVVHLEHRRHLSGRVLTPGRVVHFSKTRPQSALFRRPAGLVNCGIQPHRRGVGMVAGRGLALPIFEELFG